MAERLVYSISTGRCGTVFLTNLIRENLPERSAVVRHERFGPLNFGVHTPDLSHMTGFNTFGNVDYIREFWRRKLNHDVAEAAPTYVEMSHVLAKAGLLENLDLLGDAITIDIIVLTRRIEDIVWSYVNHFDFMNFGFMWPFTLDPRYPNTILRLQPLKNLSPARIAHWYVCEMWTRAAYYEQLLRDATNVRFHRVRLEDVSHPDGADAFLSELFQDRSKRPMLMPNRANSTRRPHFPQSVRDEVERICEKFSIDPHKMAAEFLDSGRRLATPSRGRGGSRAVPHLSAGVTNR